LLNRLIQKLNFNSVSYYFIDAQLGTCSNTPEDINCSVFCVPCSVFWVWKLFLLKKERVLFCLLFKWLLNRLIQKLNFNSVSYYVIDAQLGTCSNTPEDINCSVLCVPCSGLKVILVKKRKGTILFIIQMIA